MRWGHFPYKGSGDRVDFLQKTEYPVGVLSETERVLHKAHSEKR